MNIFDDVCSIETTVSSSLCHETNIFLVGIIVIVYSVSWHWLVDSLASVILTKSRAAANRAESHYASGELDDLGSFKLCQESETASVQYSLQVASCVIRLCSIIFTDEWLIYQLDEITLLMLLTSLWLCTPSLINFSSAGVVAETYQKHDD